MPDRHYTPSAVATRLLEIAVQAGLPKRGRMVDLAAGQGALLEVAMRELEWQALACDVDVATVGRLKQAHPDWTVGRCDVFSPRSRAQSPVVPSARGADLVLLNPPYSYRGGYAQDVSINSEPFRTSPAAATFAIACELVSPTGVVVGVMPAGSTRAQKDEALWRYLGNWGRLEQFDVLPRGTFDRAFATTVFLRWQRGRVAVAEPTSSPARHLKANRQGCLCLEVLRGTTPVHTLGGPYPGPVVPFVHTTELQRGSIQSGDRFAERRRATRGPCVLVPRVGRPSLDKICLSRSATVLTDCVIALRPVNTALVTHLQQELLEAFDSLAAEYSGTCAPYLTVRRLVDWLRRRGWHPDVLSATAPLGTCRCVVAA